MNEKPKIILETKSVSLKIKSSLILDHIDICVHEGDLITVIGPNGAGKTSLLKVMMGLLTPTSGIINHAPDLSIGYVPQKFVPDPILPLHVLSFLKLLPRNRLDNLEEIIDITKIDHLKYRALYQLSGGELQRVLIARALLGNPNLLILDEPAQNLDIHGQTILYKLIATIHDIKKCAIVMVSHDLHTVMAQTHFVYCLFHHICCSGKPENIMKSPKFQELFGDELTKMVTIYHHNHNHEHN